MLKCLVVSKIIPTFAVLKEKINNNNITNPLKNQQVMKKFILTICVFSENDETYSRLEADMEIKTIGSYDTFAEAFSAMEKEVNEYKEDIAEEFDEEDMDDISVHTTEKTESIEVNSLFLNETIAKWQIFEIEF